MRYVGKCGEKPGRPGSRGTVSQVGVGKPRQPTDSVGDLYKKSAWGSPKPYTRGINMRNEPAPAKETNTNTIVTGPNSVTITKKED